VAWPFPQEELIESPKMTSFNEVVTTFLLIRHGSTATVGKSLAGRLPGVPLDAIGQRQAHELAVRLAERAIAAIYSSPLERAVLTAEPLAKRIGHRVQIRENLIEIDFGSWQGMTLDQLNDDPLWPRFNTMRGSVGAPAGETMLEVQARMAKELDNLRQRHDGETVAVFSHADVIKAALMLYMNMPLDCHSRLEISPASVSILELADWGPRIMSVNS
jgi:probable phosphomutase (TIGR03848 family)